MFCNRSSDFLALGNIFLQYPIDDIVLISLDSGGLGRLGFRRRCRVVTLSSAGEEGPRGRCGRRGVGRGGGRVVVMSYVFESGGGSYSKG